MVKMTSFAARVPPLNSSLLALCATHGIRLEALAPLGASVRGVDLRKPPPQEVLSALEIVMAERGFLVFKDQGVLTGDEQVRASELWGARKMHSTHGVHPKAPNKHIFRLSNDRDEGILGVGPQWHNDGSFEREVFSHVGYHIVRVAEKGGGTIIAHQGAAYDALPAEEQERWKRLVSVNSNSGVLHPLVHTHPISKRMSVYLHLGMTGAVLEATPDPEDSTQLQALRLLSVEEMRDLFQTYNALLNSGFATGDADVHASVPQYNSVVELRGFSPIEELNGKRGVVKGVFNRATGRIPIQLLGKGTSWISIKPENLVRVENHGDDRCASFETADAVDEEVEGSSTTLDGKGAYTTTYEYAEGDCVFIDNLAVAHRAAPAAHESVQSQGLRILHRSTIKARQALDPPYGLPWQLNIMGPNPLGDEGVWEGGGLGFRWDESIAMQN
ncbi:hypothetical protein AB1Y20_010745 [Prymnesium parvum]|uniref:TauD/TfdA-like domain-containing protein n=1 Tax=Prymnesium parvum TaxID=97485 RepID=A0AB34IS81_PRYPA